MDRAREGAELGFTERAAVAAVLLATGEPDEAGQAAAALVDDLARMSPLHDRGYLWFSG